MRVTTSDAERFIRDATLLAREWAGKRNWKPPEGEQKLIMRLWFYWPNRRRQDTHNREKVLLDALEGVLYTDDRWVLIQEQDFTVDKQHPRVEIELEVMEVAKQMDAMKALSLMNKYAECEQCGNPMVGNGEGTLEVKDETFVRTCKCGWRVEVKESPREK